MKILFLNLYDDPAISGGGVETTLRHLTQGLLHRGVEPIVLGTRAGSGLRSIERDGVRIWQAGLRNVYWPQPKLRPPSFKRILWHALDSYNLAMQPLLRKVLEVERPDVISIHNLPGWSAAAWNTIENFKIPAVQVLHDTYLICPKSTMFTEHGNCVGQCTACHLLRLPHRSASRHLSAVVGVSNFILERHLGQGYFRDVPIQRVINNARDAGALGVGTVTRKPGSQIRIGYIGRLDPSKGVERLLQAFTEAHIPNAELWIAGSGNDDYTQMLHERWATDNVHFLGRVTQSEFYAHVDMVVVPSLWNDTFPGVVFESFAFGKPVIGSKRGGIPEMIKHGENGLLFEPDEDGALTNALNRLATDNALRMRMSEAANVSARPFLDREGWIEKYLALYQEITA